MPNASSETIIHSILHLKGVTFWGARTYMYGNFAHVLACVLVVLIYWSLPDRSKSLYNRLVLRHNLSLLLLGGILALLGYCRLYAYELGDVPTRLLWLSLQYFTNATVFWLNVVCLDMTLAITRLCWLFTAVRRQDENRRLAAYSALAWGGAALPTLAAAAFEFAPRVPEDFFLRCNFVEAAKGPRLAVNMYFSSVPALTLFCNNVLFAVTTCSIVKVQRGARLAGAHRRESERLLLKEYFLFLRLYLFMGAPWFFGTLLACFNNLVLLKVCRTLQPILWLLMLASRRKLWQRLAERCRCARAGDRDPGLDDVVVFKSRDGLVPGGKQ